MIGRRAIIGLSLLCALLFSAFAAQGASAKGTTAFTCVKKVKAEGAGFSDAHCDKEVAAGAAFEHVEVAPGTKTEAVGTNEKTASETTASTPAILQGEVALVKTEIICAKWNSTGTFENKEVGGVMQSSGSGTTAYTECTVTKPLKCAVKEPIEVKATAITRTDLGPGKNEMGAELKPAVGSKFVEITYINKGAEACALKGKTFPVEGTAISTGGRGNTEAVTSSGATAIFTKAMTEETLTFGGRPASLSSTSTWRMAGAEGNPLVGTTTAK